MAGLVYALCGVTSFICTVLLFRSFKDSRNQLLFWSGIGFGGITLNNILLFIDLIVIPDGPDLTILRTTVLLFGLLALAFGLIWETV